MVPLRAERKRTSREEEEFDEIAEELRAAREDLERKVEGLITEDDTPVDNLFSERQQRLLTNSLYASWQVPAGKRKSSRKFLAMANVGLFPAPEQEAVVVPDVLLSLDVQAPKDVKLKKHRSYFVWLYGKTPDVVIEIVSNRKGKELTDKKQRYSRMRVPYYVVYDPTRRLSLNKLTVFELQGRNYVQRDDHWLPDIELGLTIIEGDFEGVNDHWLRWCDAKGKPLATSYERSSQEAKRAKRETQRAKQEAQRADHEAQRAKQEAQRADREAQRAKKLAAKLKELGIDPDKL
ncbi:MAG: Uma2 family endonuclease [Blastocatellia bacterium]